MFEIGVLFIESQLCWKYNPTTINCAHFAKPETKKPKKSTYQGKRRLAYVQVITIPDVAKCDGKDKRQKIQKNTQLCDL